MWFTLHMCTCIDINGHFIHTEKISQNVWVCDSYERVIIGIGSDHNF